MVSVQCRWKPVNRWGERAIATVSPLELSHNSVICWDVEKVIWPHISGGFAKHCPTEIPELGWFHGTSPQIRQQSVKLSHSMWKNGGGKKKNFSLNRSLVCQFCIVFHLHDNQVNQKMHSSPPSPPALFYTYATIKVTLFRYNPPSHEAILKAQRNIVHYI